ncbi:MAG: hypothetical protein O7A98_11855 [Acidobacteria bacterium]|nr:hypothetical protein [Acidobacteriota bacterium]
MKSATTQLSVVVGSVSGRSGLDDCLAALVLSGARSTRQFGDLLNVIGEERR